MIPIYSNLNTCSSKLSIHLHVPSFVGIQDSMAISRITHAGPQRDDQNYRVETFFYPKFPTTFKVCDLFQATPLQDQSRFLEDSQATKAENRKIRDQLKLQVQERKLLLKKISMLKEQLGSVSDAKSDFDYKNLNVSKNMKELKRISEEHVQNSEHGIQCDLGSSHSFMDANSGASMYKEIIVSLNKKLANATNACDTLREQLEEILDTAEHVVEKGDIEKIKDVLAKSRSVSRNLSNDLNTGIISEDDMNGSFIEEKLENPLSDASTWNMELPNLADMQLCSSPELLFERQGHRFDEQFPEDVCNNVIEHLSEQIEKRNMELAQKCDTSHLLRMS